ncbi:hypothetical protein F5Y14DRAFT_397516 [Nemania sp. NC0429]|nr:hypothetical protein F5Y14DRAFT_397516 [Nemania sp. NC0429]
MSWPFQCLSPLGRGTLFCAAKGCVIQTFDLAASPPEPLFTWTHPACEQLQSADQANEYNPREEGGPGGEEKTGQQQQPPPKRRKLGAAGAEEGRGDVTTADGERNPKKTKARPTPPRPEIPFVILLAATEDGSHVVAVTGQDKTLWVFKHDGKGSLEEMSRRPMPKRPCSLAFTADGQTILSADKFGDVYALPLVIPREEERGAAPPTSASASSTPAATSASSQVQLRGANVFTVHSQRNRRALEDQQRQRESNAQRAQPKEAPKFAHEVLLGHVSLLTCVVAAKDSRDRPYIITADRDEHIRVSRGVPQSHVIETYCLGHASFVNALCTPRPAILVSGGGDDELLVWDWLAGKLLGTADLLTHVRGVLPDAARVAVTKLAAYEAGGESYVVATCER